MNSINHSFESFDSCGRAFITILRLCAKPLSQSQYLFLRWFFFSFRSLITWEYAHQGDIEIKKKTFCHVFWNVSNILWNSRPIRATTSKYICSVACGMFQAIDIHGDYNFFRIQSGLRWPNLLRCGCFGLRNSICDLMATGRVTHSLCNQFYWTSKLVESPRIMWWTCRRREEEDFIYWG